MVLGAPAILPSSTRLRREDFGRTKHDTAFSKWQVLIGPSDWADYEAAKEGAERYRVGNLPSVSGPGLYEIGVAVCATGSGRDVAKLDTDRIVVVYLGQADNVRSRLQHYGRSGSHLVNGIGLFKEVFSRGYPIVYRWAPMKSKSDAERAEAQLLERFDYAWNKAGNGARRPNDILMKMEKISSKNHTISNIVKMLQALSEKKVGTPIKAGMPSLDNKPRHDSNDENVNLFGRVFKFSRSQPRLVPANPAAVSRDICGVTSSDGSFCTEPPVEGRKRCEAHKGRRLTRDIISSKSTTKDSSVTKSQDDHFPAIKSTKIVLNEDLSFPSICGVTLADGFPCVRPALPGRKRCREHKGIRVNQTMSNFPEMKSNVEGLVSNLGLADKCGVHLGDGKCCERRPVKGRKRCEEHKGMRVGSYVSKLSSRNEWINAELA